MSIGQEAYPLSWPAGWPRTRPQDQKPNGGWKRTGNQYRDALMAELKRMGAPVFVVSTNIRVTATGNLSVAPVDRPRDPGVAVYFSRQQKVDFSWQEGLGLADPYPTEEQIQEAFRRLAAQHHPDRGGDVEMFRALAKHREAALRWIRQEEKQRYDYVIACDKYHEVRLNLCAIVLTIKAIRQIERCGASSLLDRAFKGFSALPAYAGAEVGATA